jgi:lipoate-protein ligase A
MSELRYLEFFGTDPAFNLAAEQYVFDRLGGEHDYFILWQNNNAIIVGKNQNVDMEINRDFVNKYDIQVVRRLSGGGAVYHDLGNLNFTFIVTSRHESLIDLHLFCQPVADTLASLGIEAKIEGRNDITINGKKFSGNSQYIKDGRVMHHGTIMFDSNLEVLERALNVTGGKVQAKGIRSVRSRVTNIKEHLQVPMTVQEFKEILKKQVFAGKQFKEDWLSEEDLCAINKIKNERYATREWNYGRSPQYSVRKSKRIDACGTLDLFMDVKDGVLAGIMIFGDFFGTKEISELEQALTGIRMEKESLNAALSETKLDDYIHNLDVEQFIRIILD